MYFFLLRNRYRRDVAHILFRRLNVFERLLVHVLYITCSPHLVDKEEFCVRVSTETGKLRIPCIFVNIYEIRVALLLYSNDEIETVL